MKYKYESITIISMIAVFLVTTLLSYETTKDLIWSIGTGVLGLIFWCGFLVNLLKDVTKILIRDFFQLTEVEANNNLYIASLKTVSIISSISFTAVFITFVNSTVFFFLQDIYKLFIK